MKKLFAYFLFAFVCSSNLLAQFSFYPTQNRPPGLNWQELETPHFRIIFPEGLDSTALRAGRILESQYEISKALTGGSLKDFPVVLTNYNDLTNGFVTSLNFRSEVDLAPFKGKNINPQSGAWLEAVLPHELIHANHANLIEPFSFAAFLSAFSLFLLECTKDLLFIMNQRAGQFLNLVAAVITRSIRINTTR